MDTVPRSLTNWFEQQMPKVTKSMEVAKISTPPIHVGGASIKQFYPRIPNTLFKGEDSTIPRICCSTDIEHALIGGRHHVTEEPKEVVKIYAFEERDIVRPTQALTKEPYRVGEIWIVPHRMSNWEIKPDVVGEMRLVSLSQSSIDVEYAMVVNREVIFARGVILVPGRYYLVRIKCKENVEDSVPEIEIDGPNPGFKQKFDDALRGYSVTF